MACGAFENVLRLDWITPKAFGAAPEDGHAPPNAALLQLRSSGLNLRVRAVTEGRVLGMFATAPRHLLLFGDVHFHG